MATIADELLNDFESDGEEQEDEQSTAFLDEQGGVGRPATVETMSSQAQHGNGGMELDGDEEEPDEADLDGNAPSHLKVEDAEDQEETKARVEKMQLQGVSDVRSVAGLMKQLQPVIEVSLPTPPKQPVTVVVYSMRKQP